jgi:hypothetical protein
MLHNFDTQSLVQLEDEWRAHDQQRSGRKHDSHHPQRIAEWHAVEGELAGLKERAVEAVSAAVYNHLRDDIRGTNSRKLPKNLLGKKSDLLKNAAYKIAIAGFEEAAHEVAENSAHPVAVRHFLVGGGLECPPEAEVINFDSVKVFLKQVRDGLHPDFSANILVKAYEETEPVTALLRFLSRPIRVMGHRQVFFETRAL